MRSASVHQGIHVADLSSVLKAEIIRVARREIRAEILALKKASSRHRAELAALRRQVASFEMQVKRLEKALSGAAVAAGRSEPVSERPARFSGPNLRKLRKRFELSAPTLASILGVSTQTVYNWETGSARPGKGVIKNIAILRKMGKRELAQRLAVMQSSA